MDIKLGFQIKPAEGIINIINAWYVSLRLIRFGVITIYVYTLAYRDRSNDVYI